MGTWQSERNREIVRLLRSGWRHRDVAERFGLSHSRPGQILLQHMILVKQGIIEDIDPTELEIPGQEM